MLNILVTIPTLSAVFPTFFDDKRKRELESIGNVIWNVSDKQFSKEEFTEKLKDIDICVTGWGTPVMEEEVLTYANRLRFIAHTGGSVKPYVTDACYERGIRVVSGNSVFAESVAEGVIAYALSSLRDIPRFSYELKQGIWPAQFYNRGLLERKVGIVGYGMIARYVVSMLKPFHCGIKVYSRHIANEELEQHQMEKATLDEIFSTCDIISIHSGMTPENHHLITEELLNQMKPGALLINTARGAIIDEEALIKVLDKKEIYAALDVYETEPLPSDHPLLECENALLLPHMGGPTIDRRLSVTSSVITDIHNFIDEKPLLCEISASYAAKMSMY
ncbi:hydroxyacid dehydrogenase [Lachnoclostridium phytofermentans]|uniref:D-isomer specific 2-hydroxyacid dehydrogenase NAD-binding n=1 Tax=Lachnoclostridium phytofermentans (strain ATCC 700394 / DSM 18823 / ISDg) TaxID=357809 RepID=A9KHB7_LACP7|nr:hydroxyacid dehydrogenase [Lachnoclostridium phytofermentans]ABX40784.1 D-isomer specific 2-hydroxyacid dehydrogenase NAD-binding [Lachnoclostridium phytofermentans ISDg]